jgi:phage-related protein
MIDVAILYSGKEYDVSAITVDGRCYVIEFIEQLELDEQAKLLSLLERTADYGPPRNTEKFKKLEGDIWEFKSYQVRILCFFDRGQIIIATHGFKKKRDKTPKREIERAERMREEYLERKNK